MLRPQTLALGALLVLPAALAGCGRSAEVADVQERLPGAAPIEECLAPTDYEPCFAGEREPLPAIGLDCSDDPDRAIPLIDRAGELTAADPDTWRVVSAFGRGPGTRRGDRHWAPREPDERHNLDDRMLLLSTGRLGELGDDAELVLAPGSQADEGATDNPDGAPLPAPIDPTSESLAPLLANAGVTLHDQISLRARIEVPPGTGALALDLALFSAEYPEFIDSPFRDVLVVWSTSEAFTGNLAVIDGQALTSEALVRAGFMAHVGDDPALSGTGFEGHGASAWLTLRAPVVAGEIVELIAVLADVGDSEVATVVALDDLRWECEACVANQTCGLSLADS